MKIIDARQSLQWAKFLSSLGWTAQKVRGRYVFIKKIPCLPYSVIKIQRPQNPLPLIEFDQIAKKNQALFIVLEPHFKRLDLEAIEKHGYKKSHLIFSHTATLHLNLNQPLKKTWNSFSENAKRNIKKARHNKLKIKVIEMKNQRNDQYFQVFFKLLKNLTDLKKIYNPGYGEYFKKMVAFKKTSVLFFAYYEGEPVAALWTAGYHKDFMIYVQTGVSNVGYKLLANYLLVWQSIKYAQEKKYKIYDFEGIFDPRFPKERVRWKNFTEFKKRFHGSIVEYPPSYIKIYNPFFKLIFFVSKFLPGT